MSLAQDTKGYLWIGARDGVYRFDGVRFEHIAPSSPTEGRQAASAMLAAGDGSIWTGYQSGGLTVYRDGVLRDVETPLPNSYVLDLAQTTDGAIWASYGGQLDVPLARYLRDRWEIIDETWGLPRDYVIDILAARDGALWMSTLGSVAVLKRGTRRFELTGIVPQGHASLSQDPAGRIWMSDKAGSRAITGLTGRTRGLAYRTPAFPRRVGSLFDRDGNLWGVNGATGVFRVAAPDALGAASVDAAATSVAEYRAKDGLVSDGLVAILEDREGNIWAGSALGLERFRAANVVVEPKLTTPARWGYILLGASDGTVYVGQADTVYRILPGGVPEVFLSNVAESEAICEGLDKAIWIVLGDRVLQVRDGTIRRLERPKTVNSGFQDCAVDGGGALWLSAERGGLFRKTNGAFERISIPGDDDPAPLAMVREKTGQVLTYWRPNRLGWTDLPKRPQIILPVNAKLLIGGATLDRAGDDILVGGGFGLARYRDGRLAFLSRANADLVRSTRGSVRSGADTWLMTRKGIVQVATDALDRAFDDPHRALHPALFDIRDGLPGFESVDGEHEVVGGGDGRVWFATTGGVVWIDPARLSRNTHPPNVAISALKVAGKVYRDPTKITLSAGASSGEIDYAALSLAIPERVQVRYQLEGVDKTWVDPGARRQAFFTNLGPGTYRFRVIASNNDGVWNKQDATLEVTIPPTFLQSKWFLALCIIAGAALLWTVYTLRMRQVRERAQAELSARLSERERIARELHDTLLQGFQGLVLRFQAVAGRIPSDQPLRAIADDALDRADAVLVDGRERVQELRTMSGDFAQNLIDIAAQLSADQDARFDLTIEGRPRDLHPIVREELQRIADEALRNAFQHAHASLIEATLTYRRGQLSFSVRDDGVGLPSAVSATGQREGHFGLLGMRERAERIGGALSVQSRAGAGAEVQLLIPGRLAYAGDRGVWWRRPFQALGLNLGGLA